MSGPPTGSAHGGKFVASPIGRPVVTPGERANPAISGTQNSRPVKSQGKVRGFCLRSGKFGILSISQVKVREFHIWLVILCHNWGENVVSKSIAG